MRANSDNYTILAQLNETKENIYSTFNAADLFAFVWSNLTYIKINAPTNALCFAFNDNSVKKFR